MDFISIALISRKIWAKEEPFPETKEESK